MTKPNLSVLDFDSGVFALAMRNQDASHQTMFGETSQFVESILAQTQATHYLGFLGGEGNFRKEVAVSRPYKGNRGPKPESVVYWAPIIEDYLVEQWGFVRCHGIEADDACSIAHKTYSQDYSLTVCGCDHDLLALSGNHYNYQKGTHQTLTPFQASYNFHHQLLTGCQGDEVPGLKGIGPAKATKILKDLDTVERLEAAVWLAYIDKLPQESLDMGYYTEQYTLLALLKEEAYGFILPQPLPVPVTQLPRVEEVDISHLFV